MRDYEVEVESLRDGLSHVLPLSPFSTEHSFFEHREENFENTHQLLMSHYLFRICYLSDQIDASEIDTDSV